MTGIIVKNISNDYKVNCNGTYYICKPRGKFRLNSLTPLVGDIVEIAFAGGKKEVDYSVLTIGATPEPHASMLNLVVEDLANAHHLAIENIEKFSGVINLGTSSGTSVKEIIEIAEKIIGKR